MQESDDPEGRMTIFVFGSNLAGRHGAGSALEALRRHGAEPGVGFGRTGQAYAIPTKGHRLERLSLYVISGYVDAFIRYAVAHPELTFDVVEIGCGLAGYKPTQIAPLFLACPRNVILSSRFRQVLDND
jgi:hypothetical protein